MFRADDVLQGALNAPWKSASKKTKKAAFRQRQVEMSKFIVCYTINQALCVEDFVLAQSEFY